MFGRNVDATDERLEILVTPQRELRFLGDRRDDRKDDECSNCGSCLGAASRVGTWICFQGLLHSGRIRGTYVWHQPIHLLPLP